MTKSITFVTGNANKLSEVRAMLPDFTVASKDLPGVPEIQGSPAEVARFKCKSAVQHFGEACLTEDTSLSFSALGGLPGPYIKHFITALPLTDVVKMLDSFEDKSATARCIFAFSSGKESEPILFEGECKGRIVKPSGEQSFGWDAMFQPDEGDGMTFAEMSKEKKNEISHRSKALDKLKAFFNEPK